MDLTKTTRAAALVVSFALASAAYRWVELPIRQHRGLARLLPVQRIGLLLAAKTWAAMQGRSFVVPDDVKFLVRPVYRHRIILKPEAEIEGLNADTAMTRILAKVEVPR